MYNICVIGGGGRIRSLVEDISKKDGFNVVALCDPKGKDALVAQDFPDIRLYTDAEEMIKTEKPHGIMIGTRCSMHTPYALLCAKYNIPMFLEKPVCTSEEDMAMLKGILHMNDKTVVSFPLRPSGIVEKVKQIVDSGAIGEMTQVQAYNNVPYGRGYYHKWYRDENETGGMFLQKSTHDFDYINYILGNDIPVRICAMKSKQIFKGDMPEGLKCADCSKRNECTESDINVATYGDPYIIGEYCCFAKDTGNEDCGSAIVEYQSGVHVVYTQNFVARKGAKKRGARFVGYLGTLEFDFYTGIITIFYHNEQRTETHTFDLSGNHFGGDTRLVANFADVVSGKASSIADLNSGILSAAMCLKAKKSAEEKIFCDICE